LSLGIQPDVGIVFKHLLGYVPQLSTTRHSPFSLSFSNRREGQSSFGNDERAIYGEVIQDLKVDGVADVRISRR
jgi:hypothetical protein